MNLLVHVVDVNDASYLASQSLCHDLSPLLGIFDNLLQHAELGRSRILDCISDVNLGTFDKLANSIGVVLVDLLLGFMTLLLIEEFFE